MLDPKCYTSKKVWHQELEKLFRQSWIFVGLLFELKGLSHSGERIPWEGLKQGLNFLGMLLYI